MSREVFLNNSNKLSFSYIKGESVCVGETDGTLQDFLDFLRKDWEDRNVPNDETITLDESV